MPSPLMSWCRRTGTALLALGLVSTVHAAGASPVTVASAVSVTPLPSGPVMPPTALPPLPPLPNGMYNGPTGMPLPGTTYTGSMPIRRAPQMVRAPQPVYHPPKICPTSKMFAKAIVSFDNTANADICARGILHPGLGVGDSFDGMTIVAIDANGVTLRGRKGTQRLSMSAK